MAASPTMKGVPSGRSVRIATAPDVPPVQTTVSQPSVRSGERISARSPTSCPTAVASASARGRAVGHHADRARRWTPRREWRARRPARAQGRRTAARRGQARSAGARPTGSGPATRRRRTPSPRRRASSRRGRRRRRRSGRRPRRREPSRAPCPDHPSCRTARGPARRRRHVRPSVRAPPPARGTTARPGRAGPRPRDPGRRRSRAPRRVRGVASPRAGRRHDRERDHEGEGGALAGRHGMAGRGPATGSLGTPRRDGGIGRRAGLKNP